MNSRSSRMSRSRRKWSVWQFERAGPESGHPDPVSTLAPPLHTFVDKLRIDMGDGGLDSLAG